MPEQPQGEPIQVNWDTLGWADRATHAVQQAVAYLVAAEQASAPTHAPIALPNGRAVNPNQIPMLFTFSQSWAHIAKAAATMATLYPAYPADMPPMFVPQEYGRQEWRVLSKNPETGEMSDERFDEKPDA